MSEQTLNKIDAICSDYARDDMAAIDLKIAIVCLVAEAEREAEDATLRKFDKALRAREAQPA